jgi:hypothetical protein
VRNFNSAEAGVASAWSADILVRSVPGLNTEADKNVRAPNIQNAHVRLIALLSSRPSVPIANPEEHLPGSAAAVTASRFAYRSMSCHIFLVCSPGGRAAREWDAR